MLSIVIVSFNTRELTRQCLASLVRFCPKAEVIVVDNASHDGSAKMVRTEFPSIRLIERSVNGGFAAANNDGLAAAVGNFLLLLNSDTVIEDDSLLRCVAYLKANPDVGAVHPGLRGPDGQPQRCLHDAPTFRDMLRRAFWLGHRPETKALQYLAGTAMVIRREALRAAGGKLDDAYFMYWEDADISVRMQAKGWKIAVLPSAVIQHLGGASGGGPDSIRRSDLYEWYAWGQHRWFARNRPAWEAVGVWMLDFCDVVRKYIRGWFHPERRTEWVHARVLAKVLWYRLAGLHPARPG